MRKSVQKYLPIALVVASLAFAVPVFATKDNSKIDNVKNEIKGYKQSDVIVVGDGIKITKADLNLAKATRQDNLSDDKILEYLVSDKVMLKKANEIGIKTSEKEIEDWVNETKAFIGQQNDPNVDEMIKSVCETVGITQEEYWAKIVPSIYKDMVTLNKYKEQIYNESTKNITGDSQKQKIYDEKVKYEISNLKKVYKINYIK